ncbi:protein-lysine N-methyltransferase EEF2KMT [Manduca sexta]|uniref:FAM86 N-terminal domain-containing protein n=1 Tax=Manduca sexta TaxID=7130 RepID=A0A921Z862_MANSE|nr:protein-lysine N-methyltransferase EEF2KMT [Manduca sexta]KAG6452745.1 hypothetical protein O3G_MSEX007760 [Manduca sexta]
MYPLCEDKTFLALVKKFYQGSLNFSLQPDDIQQMTWTWQEKFLNHTFNNELIKKYPVNKKFSRLFLKKLINFIESSQEIHDDFYSQICNLMSSEIDQDDFYYRHYVIGNDFNNTIIIKETKNTVVNGTTGMKTWEAAFVLSDWALCNKEFFKSKTILELGSGVGFTGITVTKLCKPSLFLLSDCHNEVLNTICDNIRINFHQLNETEQADVIYFNGEESSLGVTMLDWNDIGDMPQNIVPDIIIGADIVYDPVILEPLCNVLDYFYNKNKELEVFIASVIRNEDTFAAFLKTLDSKSFQYEELQPAKSIYIDWDHSTKICLIKIKRK